MKYAYAKMLNVSINVAEINIVLYNDIFCVLKATFIFKIHIKC
jgi:hypothetical protein